MDTIVNYGVGVAVQQQQQLQNGLVLALILVSNCALLPPSFLNEN